VQARSPRDHDRHGEAAHWRPDGHRMPVPLDSLVAPHDQHRSVGTTRFQARGTARLQVQIALTGPP
jgi:hypothetical protein